MSRAWPGLVPLVLASCVRGGFDHNAVDAAVDSLPPFGPPALIAELSSSANEDEPTVSADLLEICFQRSYAIWCAARSDASSAWQAPAPVAELAYSGAVQGHPCLAADGLVLYFASDRPHALAQGSDDIWVSARSDRTAPWGTPQPATALSSNQRDMPNWLAADGLSFALQRAASHKWDFYLATRPGPTAAWSAPQPIVELNTEHLENRLWISADATVAYFDSDRPGGVGSRDLYVATRDTASTPFGTPKGVPGLNSSSDEEDPWVTPDLRTIFFASTRNGSQDIFVAHR